MKKIVLDWNIAFWWSKILPEIHVSILPEIEAILPEIHLVIIGQILPCAQCILGGCFLCVVKYYVEKYYFFSSHHHHVHLHHSVSISLASPKYLFRGTLLLFRGG